MPEALAATLPSTERYGRWVDALGLWKAAGVFAVLAAAVVFVVVKTPVWLAPLVPIAWERKLGDALVGDFGGRLCHTPNGDAAMRKLTAAMDPDGVAARIDVANIDMVNAVALPGGRVVIFRGLLDEAKSPDELAGVVGHEVGHVRNRDSLQALIRQLGLSVVLGGFDGNTGGVLNGLLAVSYTRQAESEADAAAIRALARANVSPLPTAGFFARMAKGEKALGSAASALDYVSTHPQSEGRRRAFAKSARAAGGYRPVLSPGEWQSLRAMCSLDPKVEKDTGWNPFD